MLRCLRQNGIRDTLYIPSTEVVCLKLNYDYLHDSHHLCGKVLIAQKMSLIRREINISSVLSLCLSLFFAWAAKYAHGTHKLKTKLYRKLENSIAGKKKRACQHNASGDKRRSLMFHGIFNTGNWHIRNNPIHKVFPENGNSGSFEWEQAHNWGFCDSLYNKHFMAEMIPLIKLLTPSTFLGK